MNDAVTQFGAPSAGRCRSMTFMMDSSVSRLISPASSASASWSRGRPAAAARRREARGTRDGGQRLRHGVGVAGLEGVGEIGRDGVERVERGRRRWCGRGVAVGHGDQSSDGFCGLFLTFGAGGGGGTVIMTAGFSSLCSTCTKISFGLIMPSS